MAVETTVNRFAQKLGKAVRRYVAAQGIDLEHLGVSGLYDRNTGLIYVEVGLDFPIDRFQWFQGIREQIRQEFGGVAPSIAQFSLVVSQVASLDDFYQHVVVPDDELEVIDML